MQRKGVPERIIIGKPGFEASKHTSSRQVSNCPLGGNSKVSTKYIEIVSDENNGDIESVTENDNRSKKGTWKQAAARRRSYNRQPGERNNQ